MKIRIDHDGDDIHIQVERDPLTLEQFSALCKLDRAAIGGGRCHAYWEPSSRKTA